MPIRLDFRAFNCSHDEPGREGTTHRNVTSAAFSRAPLAKAHPYQTRSCSLVARFGRSLAIVLATVRSNTELLGSVNPITWRPDVKRLLQFCASGIAIVLCVVSSAGILQGDMKAAGCNRQPDFVLASLEGSEGSYQNTGAPPRNHNQFDVAFTFQGPDGSAPTAALIQDMAGNLYGTTSSGGHGLGVVFKLDSSNRETVLYAFQGPDGATPYGSLVMDSSGNLYGTTSACGDYGLGTVFKIDPKGVETVLHSFAGDPDGANPYAGLATDFLGNLYGTTENGGTSGAGTIFEIDVAGNETVLHSFAGAPTDGADPKARLLLNQDGSLYGTTFSGGLGGSGTVFRLNIATNTETVLYNFNGSIDGGAPFGGVTQDTNGVLYGTTEVGGSPNRPYGCCRGTVFTLSGGNMTVLYAFTGGNDGGTPASDLVLFNGVLYGTTLTGGPGQKGTVYSVDIATGSESVLHGFTGKGDGGMPRGGLLINPAGILFGTAQSGGHFTQGTVFQQDQTITARSYVKPFQGNNSKRASLYGRGSDSGRETSMQPGILDFSLPKQRSIGIGILPKKQKFLISVASFRNVS